MRKLRKKVFIVFFIFFALTISLSFLLRILHIFSDIPKGEELLNYSPPGITRIYDSEGYILDEIAKEKRVYVKYDDIPQRIIDAFIAVEDKNFFEHQGIDFISISRALSQNILNIGRNKRLIGGSTITQQVVKSFFLTNERTITRKIKEAILAYRVNKILSKQKILEIYLNKIYLGEYSYGIYVAAQRYFGKDLKNINIQEAALLASLPKGPSIINPYKNYKRALNRRNWAIQRMKEEGFINSREKTNAIATKIELNHNSKTNYKHKNFYTEAVKAELIDHLGEDAVYSKGLIVHANVSLRLQKTAEQVLKDGLKKYDKNQGYRGPVAKIDINSDYAKKLKEISSQIYHDNFRLGVILDIKKDIITVFLDKGYKIILNKNSISWLINTKENISEQIKKNFQTGDVVLISEYNHLYYLEQIPEVNGAIIMIENLSGKILALVGGYDYRQNKFNRAIQAKRQPGSAFKAFVYLSAFEQGILPNAIILDEPLEIEVGGGLPIWKPKNYQDNYSGLITLRQSFEKSRNLSTLRLVLSTGLDKLSEIGRRYLIYNDIVKPNYSMALGSYETTLLKITNAFSSIANNGYMKQPKLIESVYSKDGKLLYYPKDLYCSFTNQSKSGMLPPEIGFLSKKVTDDASNYQILSLLEGVIKRGSGKRAKVLNTTLAGKTGTTNNSLDAWFIGMTPDVTVGVFVGYDIPKSLGKYATGSNIALPIFIEFLKKLQPLPNRNFTVPSSITQKYINIETGDVVRNNDFLEKDQYILENFRNDQ